MGYVELFEEITTREERKRIETAFYDLKDEINLFCAPARSGNLISGMVPDFVPPESPDFIEPKTGGYVEGMIFTLNRNINSSDKFKPVKIAAALSLTNNFHIKAYVKQVGPYFTLASSMVSGPKDENLQPFLRDVAEFLVKDKAGVFDWATIMESAKVAETVPEPI